MDDLLNETLWRLADEGLHNLTREKLAQSLGKTVVEIEEQFPQDADLLLRLIYDVQAEVGSIPFSEGETPQDRVFETIMAYLDVLAPHRVSAERLWRDVWTSPQTLWALRPHHVKITETILRDCGLAKDDFCAPLRTRAYATFFLYVLHTWASDSTADQAKTMAAVDQGLQKLAEWEGYLGCSVA
jgi:hypothetical protein